MSGTSKRHERGCAAAPTPRRTGNTQHAPGNERHTRADGASAKQKRDTHPGPWTAHPRSTSDPAQSHDPRSGQCRGSCAGSLAPRAAETSNRNACNKVAISPTAGCAPESVVASERASDGVAAVAAARSTTAPRAIQRFCMVIPSLPPPAKRRGGRRETGRIRLPQKHNQKVRKFYFFSLFFVN